MNINNENQVTYNSLELLIAILLFIGSMCYRPMILGNNYSHIGFLIYLIVIVICIIRTRGKIKISRETHVKSYLAAIALFMYCLLQSVILQSDGQIAGMKTCALLIVSSTAFCLALSKKGIEVLFIRIIYTFMIAFAVSYCVSIILMYISGWDAILIKVFDYGYTTDTSIYFPFTTTYGEMRVKTTYFRRLLGFARECGIMQIFYIWGFFSADKYFEKTVLVRIIMVIGVLACFSTTGFIVFSFSLILFFDIKKVFSKKTIVVAALVAAGIYILFFASGTRIADRAVRTITDRTTAITYGLSVFVEKPIFGGGFYSTLGNAEIQMGICALASLGQIGLVGFGLWLLIFLFRFIDSEDRKRYIYTNAALFITALFAQPMIFAPVMYWFFFVNTDQTI